MATISRDNAVATAASLAEQATPVASRPIEKPTTIAAGPSAKESTAVASRPIEQATKASCFGTVAACGITVAARCDPLATRIVPQGRDFGCASHR